MKTTPPPLAPVPGASHKIAIQCLCPITGQTGSFFFAGNPVTAQAIGYARVTPVFPDLGELFRWAVENGWSRTNGSFTHGAIAP